MTDAPDQFQTLMSRLREDPALGKLLGPEAAVLIWDDDRRESPLGLPVRPPIWPPPWSMTADSLNRDSRARPRLEALAGGLAPAEGVRLERLLLDPARLSPPMTCACRLAALPDGTKVLVTVVVGRFPSPPR